MMLSAPLSAVPSGQTKVLIIIISAAASQQTPKMYSDSVFWRGSRSCPADHQIIIGVGHSFQCHLST